MFVVIASETLIVMDRLAVLVAPTESVTFAVKLEDPLAVGVPVIAPAGERLNPGGRLPAVMVQVYGETPPAAASAVPEG